MTKRDEIIKQTIKKLEEHYKQVLEKWDKRIQKAPQKQKFLFEQTKNELIKKKNEQINELKSKLPKSEEITETVIAKLEKPSLVADSINVEQKIAETERDAVIKLLNKLDEKQSEMHTTTSNTLEKVNHLSSAQVVGLSFLVGLASFVGSYLFSVFFK